MRRDQRRTAARQMVAHGHVKVNGRKNDIASANLKPGDYLVKFITPAGYSLSPINVGGDGTDSDAALSGYTGCYTLASGETNTTVDAGLYQGAAIGDRVFYAAFVKDVTDEPGLHGWGEAKDLNGIVVFATDRLSVREVVVSVPSPEMSDAFHDPTRRRDGTARA